MLRVIGIALMVCACALAGSAAERAQRAYLRELRSWCDALAALYDELRFRASPLPLLLSAAARHAGGRAGDCLMMLDRELTSTGDWRKALDKLPGYLPKESEWEIKNALSVLGEYGLETQLAALTEAQTKLQKRSDALWQELSSKSRVYRAAGLSVGLMLALILW